MNTTTMQSTEAMSGRLAELTGLLATESQTLGDAVAQANTKAGQQAQDRMERIEAEMRRLTLGIESASRWEAQKADEGTKAARLKLEARARKALAKIRVKAGELDTHYAGLRAGLKEIMDLNDAFIAEYQATFHCGFFISGCIFAEVHENFLTMDDRFRSYLGDRANFPSRGCRPLKDIIPTLEQLQEPR